MGLGSFFMGSKGPKVSEIESNTGKGTMWGFGNMAGAQNTGDTNGIPNFDWSQSFKPVTPKSASSQYDFSGIDKAENLYQKPGIFGAKYDPMQFNFESLPDQYYQGSYDLGAKNIRREGAGNLKQMNEALGPRNQGLLFKSASNAGRLQNENLANMAAQLGQTRLEQKSQLGKEQQLAQAGEGFKGYQSRADLEKTKADDQLKRAAGMESTGRTKLAGQLDATNAERSQLMDLLKMMMQEYQTQYTSRRGAKPGDGLGRMLSDSLPDSLSVA